MNAGEATVIIMECENCSSYILEMNAVFWINWARKEKYDYV